MPESLINRRRKIIDEGLKSIQRLRGALISLKNADEIECVLKEIEASKVILFSMYENKADIGLLDFLDTYNRILNELLHELIVEGTN